MAKTYAQIAQQIEELQREAEKLKRQEISDVIARIKEAIRVYSLTAADLGFGRSAKPVVAKKAGPRRRKAGDGVVKYRDGDGRVWGGRGPRPKWLRDAIASGRKLEDFAV